MTKKRGNYMNSFADYIDQSMPKPKKINEYQRGRRLQNDYVQGEINHQPYQVENTRSYTRVNNAYANNLYHDSNHRREETAYLKQQRRLEYLNSPQGIEQTRLQNELRAFTLSKMITFLIKKPIQCITKKENNRYISINYTHYLSLIFYAVTISCGFYLYLTTKYQTAYLYIPMALVTGIIIICLWFALVGKVTQIMGKNLMGY
jgi:hypothetical protein